MVITYISAALDREVPDEHEGQADGTHNRPDKVLSTVELTVNDAKHMSKHLIMDNVTPIKQFLFPMPSK